MNAIKLLIKGNQGFRAGLTGSRKDLILLRGSEILKRVHRMQNNKNRRIRK